MAGSKDSVVTKKKGVARGHACSTSDAWRPSSYHGTNLRTPFFFLLVDSLILSPWVPVAVGAASVLDASVVFAVPEPVVALASVPVVTAASPLAAAGAADVDSPGVAELDSGCAALLGAPAVPGALFSGAVPAGVVPSAGAFASAGAVLSASVLVPPGVTVATMPVVFPEPPVVPPPPPLPPTTMRDELPPVSTSVAEVVSGSGSRVGSPNRAAALISPVGPECRTCSGFFAKLVCGRGAFCSATMRARAFGSGCGTGTFIATSRGVASGASLESG